MPKFGVFRDLKSRDINGYTDTVLNRIWRIGGTNGWYYGNLLWNIRGFLDKVAGGVGLRRGRTHPDQISPGDSLDFWRVLVADKQNRRLLLFAEMKLPGEAWLEWTIAPLGSGSRMIQRARFHPRGLLGRAYWYSLLPFHRLVFAPMASKLADPDELPELTQPPQ